MDRCNFKILTLEGPEDDSIGIETCCPNTIINKIKFFCVLLIHHCIFIYKWIELYRTLIDVL